jgi:peroxiredoxin Q/BCP
MSLISLRKPLKKTKRFFTFLIIVILFFIGCSKQSDTKSSDKLTVGMKAPNFTLTDQNGKKHALTDYQNKNVALYFYPKDDTPG